MTPPERALLRRLHRRAARLQPELARRLFAAYAVIERALTESELADAVTDGTLERLVEDILSDRAVDAAMASLRARIDQDAMDAGRDWTQEMPSRFANAVFDVLDPVIRQAIRDLDTRVIRELRDEIRESVREAVRLGIEAGKGPRAVAVRVRDSIGLSPSQARWVANFRAELESGDRAALRRMLGRGVLRRPDGSRLGNRFHAGGEGLSGRDLRILDRILGTDQQLRPDQIERMVKAYRKRLIAFNAETHTRSIALDTHRLGQRLSWQSAINQGIVDVTRLRRTWVDSHDSRVRPEHHRLNGTTVRWNEPYPNGEMIPGQSTYNCRCIERITLVPENRMAA